MGTKEKYVYGMERYTPEQLIKLDHAVRVYAMGMGGLPQNHSEVFAKRGWMVPFLFGYDDLLWGRWDYWSKILLGQVPITASGPIPQIKWCELGAVGAMSAKKMLEKCMQHHEATMDNFAHWLLWGMAGTREELKISPKLNEHYYREFDLFMVLAYPKDYMSDLLSEHMGKGQRDGNGYFPTPFHVCELMAQMNTTGKDPEKLKFDKVMDPCIGCGAMLLPMSNYSFFGYGQDINGTAINLAKVQMYWYAPWFARPYEEKEEGQCHLLQGDALSAQIEPSSMPESIPEKK